jgi:hypothetical protein
MDPVTRWYVKSAVWTISAALLLVGCGGAEGLRTQGVSSPAAFRLPVETATARRAPEPEREIVGIGYATIDVQSGTTPAQRRLMAVRASRLDAYRHLAEQVFGQRIDSETTLGDLVVRNDGLRGRIEGVVYGAELVSVRTLGEDTYETTLRLNRANVVALRRTVRR